MQKYHRNWNFIVLGCLRLPKICSSTFLAFFPKSSFWNKLVYLFLIIKNLRVGGSHVQKVLLVHLKISLASTTNIPVSIISWVHVLGAVSMLCSNVPKTFSFSSLHWNNWVLNFFWTYFATTVLLWLRHHSQEYLTIMVDVIIHLTGDVSR